MYNIKIKKQALKSLKRLPLKDVKAINNKILALEIDPRPVYCKKLRGYDNIYRIRIGNYRVVYSVFDDKLTIEIIHIAHCKSIYSDIL